MENILSKIKEEFLTKFSENPFLMTIEKQAYFELPIYSKPYLFLILEGKAQLNLENGLINYEKGSYILSKIDTPKFLKVIEPPFNALVLQFSIEEIISVMIELDCNIEPNNNDEDLINNILRLVQNNNDIFLKKNITREIIYNLLTGVHGKEFINSVVKLQNADEIYDINNWIKENFKSDFSVEDLAKLNNMSVSTFHSKFKNAVGMSPIQCQKKLRLLEAKRLMFDTSMNVTEAALEVGYESISQFNRDYKKLFGFAPCKDIAQILKQNI
ncbi:TPA: AraC family transcriptional regulator [Candidatus Gastranaerophilales bacterium HUM_10]|nr:MAG TPA: AraC family transcriptional regulator [Candidatus Gastranaerophilales bacterium HUM_10]